MCLWIPNLLNSVHQTKYFNSSYYSRAECMICQGVTDVYNCHHNTLELNGNWIVAFKMPPNIFHKLNSNTPLKRQLYCGSIHTLSSKLVASLVDGFKIHKDKNMDLCGRGLDVMKSLSGCWCMHRGATCCLLPVSLSVTNYYHTNPCVTFCSAFAYLVKCKK